MIDGLVVIEPNINPDSAGKFAIDFGGDKFGGHGTSLYDNHTLMAVYAGCAAFWRAAKRAMSPIRARVDTRGGELQKMKLSPRRNGVAR